MSRVVIGVDPHKRSSTIEVIDDGENVLAVGRYGTDRDGYQQMLAAGRAWPDRLWAVEGCQGVGRYLAQRLVADGELVVDVPAKLSARARVFSTGQGRKTDAADAHAVAVVALRTPRLARVRVDDATVALRLLAERRDELGAARTLTVNRLHRLLADMVPGGAKQFLSAQQAKALLTGLEPADGVVAVTRVALVEELVVELEAIDARITTAKRQLDTLVRSTGSGLLRLNGIGPSGAARLLGDIGQIARFPTKGHFASWNGTAPIEASSGDVRRHRLSRAGNRRINRVLHIMAIVQLRHDTPGRRYYDRKRAEGKSPMEAMRAIKRRLSDVVYRQLVQDQRQDQRHEPGGEVTGPGGQAGATTDSSAAGYNPDTGALEKSLPGPATTEATPATPPGTDHTTARTRRPSMATARSRGQAAPA
ncbi:transposase [Motilibacter rhizosphaerae]|uniref:Transposase n=1 Tax=Motilibacter rhizosphaerae TaxID=598652 RepID=A0A4Q7NWU9_9ACTN|nr:IS110 family transposase [Motilibacter rhizosphaerae]RZS91674.1 transposase [Motilibacter rhizosphaerae]